MATLRQRRFAEIVQKNLHFPGKKPALKQMAKAAGYSDSVASHFRDNILESKGMKQLLVDILPDSEAAKIHAELIGSEVLSSFPFDISLGDGKIKQIFASLHYRLLHISSFPIIRKKVAYCAVPNAPIRQRGLELYHKVMGNYSQRKAKQIANVIDEMPEGELDEKLEETDEMAARYKKYALPLMRKRLKSKFGTICI